MEKGKPKVASPKSCSESLMPVVETEKEPKLTRISIPAANKLIGKKIPVPGIDHGFVELIDYMGSDQSIVRAARVSYGAGTKSVSSDKGLIRYLMRHRHTTPFEMVEFVFLVNLPIYVARQMIRHRTANVNEYSGRYSVILDEYDVPGIDRIKGQDMRNKQGRKGDLPVEVVEEFRKRLDKSSMDAYKDYVWALDNGVAREIARLFLPVNFFTRWYWKMDLHNLFHFLGLRLDAHAQWEIRAYSQIIADIVKKVAPIAYEAFEDFALHSTSFSRRERHAVAELLRGKSFEESCAAAGLPLKKEDGTPMKSGEGVEFREKLDGMRNILREEAGATA
ncbi:MAG: FAD-dependent thymidylate synthase [Candidatus Micrarchaeales archaeon]|nr:FAD-dependent thymidylate synthase [Candidatus Micrarchaeales archaeon]